MSSRFVTPTGSDALGAQALVGGKGETCDAEVGVAACGGPRGGAAGRDGGVCGRGLGAGWAVAGFAGRPDAEELNGRADRLECWVVALMSVNRACGERVPA